MFKAILAILAALILTSTACSSTQPHDVREILKTIRVQADHTVPTEMLPVLYAAEGAIEAMLPVDVQVVTTGLADRTSACLVRVVSWIEVLGWGAFGNPASVEWRGADIYPCEIKIKEGVTDPDRLRLYLTHELGHVILNDGTHNTDPQSIMTNAVELGGSYRFTERDIQQISN